MTKNDASQDKDLVVQILSDSFQDNKSVNLVVGNRKNRIPALMRYSYAVAMKNGKVFISKNRQAIALVLFPTEKKFSLRLVWENIKLAVNVIGLHRVPSILKRESAIKKLHPDKPFVHLWYIGVHPDHFGRGHGSALLQEIMAFAEKRKCDIYLETSTERNIGFYTAHGFENYANIETGLPFTLMLFRRLANS